jgi:effector-binding domain-containing protein
MKRVVVAALALLVGAGLAMAQAEVKKAEPAPPVVSVKPETKMVGEITVATIPAMNGATVMERAADFIPKEGAKPGPEGMSEACSKMMNDGFGKLTTWMTAGGKPVGPPLAIYFEDPAKTPVKDLTCKVVFPTTPDAKGSDVVKIEAFPETEVAKVQYSGPYEQSKHVWTAVDAWIAKHRYAPNGPPMEVYLKGPNETQKPEEYLTEIRVPVKKVEMPKPPQKPGEVKKNEGGHQ